MTGFLVMAKRTDVLEKRSKGLHQHRIGRVDFHRLIAFSFALFFVSMPCGILAQTIAVEKPRVGILLAADGRHRDEFDGALKTLGWSAERFPSTPEVMRSLPDKLPALDMLIVAPLFNLDGKGLPGEDRGKYLKFLEGGGMIAVTDGSYAGVRAWLADIDPALGGLEEGKCNSSQWAVLGATVDGEPAHPLRFFPSRITEPNSWPHFHKPATDSKWQVVAKCSEGFPVTFVQKIGKGFVTLSALRQPSAEQLGNFHSCLLLNRAGIALESFDLPKPAMGEGRLRLELAGGAPPESGGFIYEITAADGRVERFEKDITGEVFELPYRFTQRGPVKTRLIFKRGAQQFPLASHEAELPALLVVKPNAYRGILSTARRFPAVNFGVELAPFKEDLVGAGVRVSVLDAKGSEVGAASRKLEGTGIRSFQQPVALEPALPEGDYKVRAALSMDGKKLAEAETAIRILAPREAQTIADEDRTLLVNGKPFFPLGLYHVNKADYPQVAKLGINTVQFWTWDGRDGLERAAAAGLKVIFELNHKNAEIVTDVVSQYAANPAILMWYGLDEPAEASHGLAEVMLGTFREKDDQHPVYMVSCRPDIFREQAKFGDVFAHDPYGSPQKALDWMRKANAAVDHRKAVIVVPGVFGKETAAELRATAYLSLANDARGIMWYPWSQTGGGPAGIGLKNSAEQQAVIKELCSEIRTLHPALTAPVRVPFQSGDGKLQGIYCRNGSRQYVLIVNSTMEEIDSEATIPGDGRIDRTLQDLFGKREDKLTITQSRLRISLRPYETRVYWCD